MIASVEDSLGVPSPEELAQEGTEGHGLDQETCRLADGKCLVYCSIIVVQSDYPVMISHAQIWWNMMYLQKI